MSQSTPPVTDESILAQRDRALACLRCLVRQLERLKGYAPHEEQQELREARALIVEYERKDVTT